MDFMSFVMSEKPFSGSTLDPVPLVCHTCGNTAASQMAFQHNPPLTKVSDIWLVRVECLPCARAGVDGLRLLSDVVPNKFAANLERKVSRWLDKRSIHACVQAVNQCFEPIGKEADKPVGTRDVEKFQKEERDKQLRELFGF